MRSKYSTIQLPRHFDDNPEGVQLLNLLVERFKALRLESLQTNPEAFSNTYEREVAVPFETWESRLKSPSARTFIAVEYVPPTPTATESQELESRFSRLRTMPWVGMGVVTGPKVYKGEAITASTSLWNIYHLPKAEPATKAVEGDNASTVETIFYGVNAVYVSPTARGHGVGKQLIQTMFESAKRELATQNPGGSKGRFVVFVEKKNIAARGLYERCGFESLGEETYTRGDGGLGTAITLVQPLD